MKNAKEIKILDRKNYPLSELCDEFNVEYAATLIGDSAGVKEFKLNKEVEAPFDIAGMTVDQAVAAYGADAAFKYVYDWANDEIENQENIKDGTDEREGYEYDDELYCQLNIFVDNLDNGGEFEVEEDFDETTLVSSDYRGEQ